MQSHHPNNENMARVEIPRDLLEQLINSGVLPGAACRCLNATAKNTMWQSLLNNSIKSEY